MNLGVNLAFIVGVILFGVFLENSKAELTVEDVLAMRKEYEDYVQLIDEFGIDPNITPAERHCYMCTKRVLISQLGTYTDFIRMMVAHEDISNAKHSEIIWTTDYVASQIQNWLRQCHITFPKVMFSEMTPTLRTAHAKYSDEKENLSSVIQVNRKLEDKNVQKCISEYSTTEINEPLVKSMFSMYEKDIKSMDAFMDQAKIEDYQKNCLGCLKANMVLQYTKAKSVLDYLNVTDPKEKKKRLNDEKSEEYDKAIELFFYTRQYTWHQSEWIGQCILSKKLANATENESFVNYIPKINILEEYATSSENIRTCIHHFVDIRHQDFSSPNKLIENMRGGSVVANWNTNILKVVNPTVTVDESKVKLQSSEIAASLVKSLKEAEQKEGANKAGKDKERIEKERIAKENSLADAFIGLTTTPEQELLLFNQEMNKLFGSFVKPVTTA